jgi:integrase
MGSPLDDDVMMALIYITDSCYVFRHPFSRVTRSHFVPSDTDIGIQKTLYGYRAYVRVKGRLYAKRFDNTATKSEMRDWRAAKRTDVLRALKQAKDLEPQPGTLADDVQTYLASVRAMPTYAWREKDMEAWVALLGGSRTRASVSAPEIRTALQHWRMMGRKDGKPLSESACNHRRTALMHFYTVMNGKSGTNPVRDIPRFREPDPEPRGVSFAQLHKVFAAMPDTKTKARVLVMALTGLPHSTLMRLTEDSVDWDRKTLMVPRRRKGKGTKTRVLPLTPEAVKAFRMLHSYDGWGAFSRDSLRRSLHRACKAAGVPLMRGYDLRHSFGTAAYLASGDIRAVQGLLDHSDVRTTERYMGGAVDARMQDALESMPQKGRKVAGFVTSNQKTS